MNDLGQFLGNGLIIGCIYALMAAGLTLVFGYMGIVNFAHGEFYMIGAFLSYTVTTIVGMPFVFGLGAAALGGVVFGFVIDRLILKPLRKYDSIEMPMLAMIAMAIILPNLAIVIWGPVPRSADSPVSGSSLDLGVMKITPQSLFIVVVAIVLMVAAYLFMSKTRIGLTMRGTFQDPTASWLMGVNVSRVYAVTFAFGAVLAAVSGALISTVFQVTPSMGALATGKSFVVVILGGLGSFSGAIAGGLLLGIVESLGAGYFNAGYKDTFGLLTMVLILLLRPQGIFGSAKTVSE